MKTLIKEALKFPLEASMAAVERQLITRNVELTVNPIFIIAPARSGSTLLYQTIIRYFDVCYFSNSIERFPRSPICIAYLLAHFGACDPPESFQSRLGHTEGGKGPTDATKIWNRWFRDHPQYIPAGVLTPEQRSEVRTTIARFQQVFSAPFVNKTQRNCGRILALAEIFPEAVFIRLHRDPFDMASSRLTIYNNASNENRLWQSAKPSNFDEIVTDDPIEHICQQVVFTEADIERDRLAVGSHNFIDVEYESFCNQPIETMRSIAHAYREITGVSLTQRHAIPSRFDSAGSRGLTETEAKAIRAHLERYWATVKNAQTGCRSEL